jgi:peroxiredoxin
MEVQMKKLSPSSVLTAIALAAILSSLPALAQEPQAKPALLDQPVPDFTLPAFQAGTVTLSALKGKNVMIVFPRGWAAEGHWCTICNYMYADLIDVEKSDQLRKKFDLEILYVMPYGKDTVQQWIDALPDQLDKIKAWKNPPEADRQDEKVKARMEMARKGFPKDLSAEKGKVPTPFPILMDEDRKVTRGLGLFMTEWSGSKVDQLIPTVFVIDKQGILRFKYISQNTWDRPSWDYMKRVLEVVSAAK